MLNNNWLLASRFSFLFVVVVLKVKIYFNYKEKFSKGSISGERERDAEVRSVSVRDVCVHPIGRVIGW